MDAQTGSHKPRNDLQKEGVKQSFPLLARTLNYERFNCSDGYNNKEPSTNSTCKLSIGIYVTKLNYNWQLLIVSAIKYSYRNKTVNCRRSFVSCTCPANRAASNLSAAATAFSSSPVSLRFNLGLCVPFIPKDCRSDFFVPPTVGLIEPLPSGVRGRLGFRFNTSSSEELILFVRFTTH